MALFASPLRTFTFMETLGIVWGAELPTWGEVLAPSGYGAYPTWASVLPIS